MNINDFLPDKVCINLDRRPERWVQARSQFALHDLKSVRRFSALDGATLKVPKGWESSPGAYGCLQSHLEVVREARQNKLSQILILEDDVVLDPDFKNKFSRYVRQLPSDWDMLFFGGLHLFVHPERISDNIVRLAHSYSTFAYVLKQSVYDSFIEINSRSLKPVDMNNAVLQRRFNCYSMPPRLVGENYSDTQYKTFHPWYLKEGIVLASPDLDRIQRQSVVILAHRDRTPDGSQTRNLHFKLKFYSQCYPHMTLLVVEHDQQPSLDPRTLRNGVQYEFLQDGGAFDPGRCFQAGFELFEASKEFFVFSESDIHLARENVIANLELCLRYDFVSSFSHVIDLTEEDSIRLINDEDIDLSGYGRTKRSDICHGACIFTRTGLRKVGGWKAAGQDGKEETPSLRVKRMLSFFESPCKALRLSQTHLSKSL